MLKSGTGPSALWRKREKKYRTIVENAAGGIYQMTMEGRYLSANPAMARILGYEKAEDILNEIQNANTQLYVDQSVRNKYLNDLDENDGVVELETQIRRKDGKIIWIRENIRGVKDDENNIVFYEGSMEDITERKKADLALKEAKMQSDLSNRAKSEFLANMSHELRTPLNAIIGFSEIIKNEVFGPLGHQEYQTYSNEIHDSGRKLLNIINDILDVSRIEAGDRQLNEGIVDIRKIIQDVFDLNLPKAKAGNLVLMNKVSADIPQIIGEAHAFKQMMLNLISNALKFTPSGGHVTISAETCAFRRVTCVGDGYGYWFDKRRD
jgi:PAS domain S-box-containing protein